MQPARRLIQPKVKDSAGATRDEAYGAGREEYGETVEKYGVFRGGGGGYDFFYEWLFSNEDATKNHQ